MPSIIEVDTIKNKTGTQNTVLSTDGSGNNTLNAGVIKSNTGSNTGLTIASDGQITVNQNNPTITLGSNTTFPSGMMTFRSAVIEDSTDSGDVDTDASNLFIGFGTIQGPIALATGYRMNIYATGGQFSLDNNAYFGPAINYKTGSTFSNETDGSVVRSNFASSTSKQSQTYTRVEVSNTTGSSVNYYFRPAVQSKDSRGNVQWFANTTYAKRFLWYEFVKI